MLRPARCLWRRTLRDTAAISLLLCTGLRSLCALDVADLRQGLGGEVALRVRHGKGNKQRLVPYGTQVRGEPMVI